MGHVDLVANGNQTFGKIVIVLPKQVHSDEDIIDISEDQGILPGIAILLLEESDRMISPMATGVEVVRGVVAIVERESVTLYSMSKEQKEQKEFSPNLPEHQSM